VGSLDERRLRTLARPRTAGHHTEGGDQDRA
jgi:hypothetical protein